ncbi:MAG: hypothetical protein OEV44_15430 [Spirochaetota bacterium]|nr:hypothetical protein [Spirochaetota bacterium]
MSFYAKINTQLSNKKYLLCALDELERKGEISNYQLIEKKDKIKIDRDGDILNIIKDKTGNFQVTGDVRIGRIFADRLKQIYAYESIKDNLPLDFEIAKEVEENGEISILLKG